MSKIRLYGATSGYVDLAAPAVADDATLTLPTGANGFGKVLQVVSTTDNTTATYSVGAMPTETADTMSLAITPSGTASKVLVTCSISVSCSGNQADVVAGRLYRGGVAISGYSGASGTSKMSTFTSGGANSTNNGGAIVMNYLDSPATASSVTYSVRLGHAHAGTVNIYRNRPTGANPDSVASTITLFEVAP